MKEVVGALGLEGASPAPHPKGKSTADDNEGKHRPRVGTKRRPPCSMRSRHHETVLEDVSARRTRPEEHGEGVGGFFVGCLLGWQAHLGALHAHADAERKEDRQSTKSLRRCMITHGKRLVKAWTKQEASWPPAPPKLNCTLPCSNRVDGSSGFCQRLARCGWAKRGTSRFSICGSRRPCAPGNPHWTRFPPRRTLWNHLTNEQSDKVRELLPCARLLATCADGQPRVHWPRLREK